MFSLAHCKLCLNKEVEYKRERPGQKSKSWRKGKARLEVEVMASHGEREIRKMASTRKLFINRYYTHYSTGPFNTCERSNAIETGKAGNGYR